MKNENGTEEAGFKLHFIGIKEGRLTSSQETKRQIEKTKSLKCQLRHPITGERLSWEVFDNPEEKDSLFQAILRDRELRVDRGLLMLKKPPFCAVTALDDIAIRLEFYGGYEEISLIADLRNRQLQSVYLPSFIQKNPKIGKW